MIDQLLFVKASQHWPRPADRRFLARAVLHSTARPRCAASEQKECAMLVTINGQQQDVPVMLKREQVLTQGEQLFVGDRQATRVTHSRADDVPVIVQIEDLLVEVDPHDFYAIDGMHHDWQPGDQSEMLAGI